MEEHIGKVWHKYISKKSSKTHETQRVFFLTKKRALTLFYHLLGGHQAKELKITDKRPLLKQRTVIEKISGAGKTFFLPWQDEKNIYLPESLACFSQKKDNEMLYFWLVAMMCHIKVNTQNIIAENMRVTQYLLNTYVGFNDFYTRCSQEFFTQFPALRFIESLHDTHEYSDDMVNTMHPFVFWIYPCISNPTPLETQEDDHEQKEQKNISKSQTLHMKKRVNQMDDKKKTDGLLVFLPDGIMSILEQVNVDRSEDDSFDDNALYNAQDLDEITLAKKRSNLNARIKMDLETTNEQTEQYPLGKGHFIDEWDYAKNQYLKNYVHIKPNITINYECMSLPKHLNPTLKKVQNELDLMRIDRIKKSHLPYGDEINLDQWIYFKSHTSLQQDKHNFFESFEKKTRDISCLILADISLSTEAGITSQIRVIDMIKDTLMVFSHALTRLQDPFAMYAFSSLKNNNVHFHILKNFQEKYSDSITGRIHALKPGYYTRLGAAIRESTKILQQQHSKNKLLLIISDGKPNDMDKYDGRYGIEDTKKAIIEAKQKGLTPFCITIDIEAKDYLPYLFGKEGFLVIKDSKKLSRTLPHIYMNLTK
jgi:nitric oxide reductase NorD protein